MNPHFETLEFPAILRQLKELAVSDNAKAVLDRLEPALNERICIQRMAETTAARRVLDSFGSPPLPVMNKLEETVTMAEIGAMLMPEQLSSVAAFAAACKRMTGYLARVGTQDATLSSYGQSVKPLTELQNEIQRCVLEDEVRDEASASLRDLRRKKINIESKIKEKLNQILRTHKQYLTDGYITNRGGHYVLPVQRQYQKQIAGAVVDTSASGTTVFIEPSAVSSLRDELSFVMIAQDEEMRRVLYTLSAQVAEEAEAIRKQHEADGRAGRAVRQGQALRGDARPPRAEIGGERRLVILDGRHPLLSTETCVPLNLRMDNGDRGVIITGPNTGGKTVAIKTVGLLSLMAQCGLHIPCGEGSYIAMQDGYWCDIGDSQNISQNLSTFSGHITNVIHILESASRDSLVLLDELGSGTDPAEGMGIGIAVLEELRLRGCMFMVTTHYPQIKTYAETAEHVLRARMAFDPETLRPAVQPGDGKDRRKLRPADRRAAGPCAAPAGSRAPRGVRRGTDQAETGRARRDARAQKPPDPADATEQEKIERKFTMGDSVLVLPQKETGIVYRPADDSGDVIVQVKGGKARDQTYASAGSRSPRRSCTRRIMIFPWCSTPWPTARPTIR